LQVIDRKTSELGNSFFRFKIQNIWKLSSFSYTRFISNIQKHTVSKVRSVSAWLGRCVVNYRPITNIWSS